MTAPRMRSTIRLALPACEHGPDLDDYAGEFSAAGTRFRFFTSTSISIEARDKIALSTYMPNEKLPVAVLISPNRAGPTAPEVVPIVLITAIPAAAPVPDKYCPGAAQMMGIQPCTPAVASVRQAMPHKGLWDNSVIDENPIAPRKAGMAKCQRSSFLRSE